MSYPIRGLAILLALVLLNACSTRPPALSASEQARHWQEHRLAVAQLAGWSLQARVSISHNNEAWSGKLLWLQQPAFYRIHFNAPFGQGAFQLEGEAEHAVMRLADGQVFEGASAEVILNEQLGWNLPVAALRYWVAGVPLPDSTPPLILNEQGRLSRLEQGPWAIHYTDYAPVDDMLLPRKLSLENPQLKVRMVIDEWSLNPAS